MFKIICFVVKFPYVATHKKHTCYITKWFIRWSILQKIVSDIGNGKIECYENTQLIELRENFCSIVDSKNALIESVFPNIRDNYSNHQWLFERAILAAKNVHVDEINFTKQETLLGKFISFKSIDTVTD